MKALRTTILIFAMCLVIIGCSGLRSETLTVKPPFEQDMKHSTGNSLLAESLEKAKPLVDLNLEE